MNLYRTILNFIPGVLTIPFWIGSVLYFLFLPEITYYALGIMLDIWIPALRSFWGFPILFILLMIPFVGVILVWLLTIQSFWVLFKFLIGSYYPRDELLGFVTMFPASMVIISYVVSYFINRSENSSASSNSSSHIPPLPRNDNTSNSETRGEDSTASRASRETTSPNVNRRGADSKAAKAARESGSSDSKVRGRESTAAKAAKKSSTSNPKSPDPDDLYFDNREYHQEESSSNDDLDKDDDLYFDNTVKK